MNIRFDEMRLARDLPSPSGVGLKILELTSCAEYDPEELVALISADPALSGRILRLANAASHDVGERASSAHQAATRLGPKVVRDVALGFSLVETRMPKVSDFDVDSFWSQSLANAVAAEFLAEATGEDAAALFSLGLLSGIGRLALACVHPARYGRICGDPRSSDEASLLQLEWSTFEIDNLNVAGCLMEDWGLPVTYTEALDGISPRVPRDPDSVNKWADILIAARLIGRVLSPEMRNPITDRGRALAALPLAVERLGLPQDGFIESILSASSKWQEWAEFTGIPTMGANLGDLSLALVQSVEVEPPPVVPVGRRQDEDRDLFADEAEFIEDEADHELRPTRVLLVDDDPAMLKLLAFNLENEGFEVFMATEGSVALELAVHMQPEVVIIDWFMPLMSGYELLRVLRKSEIGRRVYAIGISADGGDARALEALDCGADDFMSKPINPKLFAARVRVGSRVVAERQAVERSERINHSRAAEMGLMGRRLRFAALTDGLTGLPNRRQGMRLLEAEWERSDRQNAPLSVIAIDIDYFKAFNDTAGHDIGDAVLREVAQTLSDNTRAGDAVARMGGEEFLSVVGGAEMGVARIAAERLRHAIDQLPPIQVDKPMEIKVSVGVAEREPWMRCMDDLLREADKALYAAKESGRNRVCIAGELPGNAASA
jgi:diguanylate cyclase (GGDEF)-like protein